MKDDEDLDDTRPLPVSDLDQRWPPEPYVEPAHVGVDLASLEASVDRFVATADPLLKTLEERFPDAPPSQLPLITNLSSSLADQEVWLRATDQTASDATITETITYADAILAAYRERFPK